MNKLKYSNKKSNQEINVEDVCYLLSNIIMRIIISEENNSKRGCNVLYCSRFEYSKKKQSSSYINSDTRKNNDGSKAVGKTRGEIVESADSIYSQELVEG